MWFSGNGDRGEAAGRCLVIAEVAQAHDGSLGMAHAYVDAASAAGADAIKFQTHIAAAESSPDEPWRVKFSYQDERRFDYWKRMEFTEPQWLELKRHAKTKGLQFLSSPFSVEAAEMLDRIGVPAWKVASGELSNGPLVDFLIATGKPILMSSGMSNLAELDRVVEKVRFRGNPLLVMQCTSAYPCPAEKVGLNVIPLFRERYRCAVGLSDHSGTIFPGLAAVTLGVEALEIHITMSREMFGPDVPASITTAELRQLVEGVRFIEKMRANPADKDQAAENLVPIRRLFTRSLAAARDLAKGSSISESDLVLRKPGTGIPADRIAQVTGRILTRSIGCGELLRESDLAAVAGGRA